MCTLGVEDDEITTEAGAFYDGLNLRLCLQRLKRNSADTRTTSSGLAFQRITVSLLAFSRFANLGFIYIYLASCDGAELVN